METLKRGFVANVGRKLCRYFKHKRRMTKGHQMHMRTST